jgi:hypothetical protein
VTLILAACGEDRSEEPALRLSGPGWTAQAPAGWEIERRARTVIARPPGGGDKVVVAEFPLPKPFRPALWPKAKPELRKLAETIAVQTSPDAKVSKPEELRVAGYRALAFDITYDRNGGPRVDKLLFLLVGRREFQLTCSISLDDRAAGDAACAQLRRTFRLRSRAQA